MGKKTTHDVTNPDIKLPGCMFPGTWGRRSKLLLAVDFKNFVRLEGKEEADEKRLVKLM